MARRARVTLVQSRGDGTDPAATLAAMQEQVRRHRASDLVVFPELALFGHDIAAQPPGSMRAALRAVPAEDVAAFDRTIAEAGARVVYGELLQRDGKLYNVATYTDGRSRASYAKVHTHWTESFEPGTEFKVLETPLGPTGLLICYDAAFPEVPRLLALRGARAIVNLSAIPAAFPLKYVHRRLVACSIENQVFTLFANRAGQGFLGGSAAVDPRGEVLAVADAEQDSLTVELDLAEVDAWRQEEPLFPHRRPALYGGIAAP